MRLRTSRYVWTIAEHVNRRRESAMWQLEATCKEGHNLQLLPGLMVMITAIRTVTKHIMNNSVQKQHVITNYVIVCIKRLKLNMLRLA
jgi:hypothetical protein